MNFLVERFNDSFSWITELKCKKEKKAQYINYFMNIPKCLHTEKFFNEIVNLPIRQQKYLLCIETRGSKEGTKKAKQIEGKKYCVGPLCILKNKEERYKEESEFIGSYCRDCKTYISLYDFGRIIQSLEDHSKTRVDNYPGNNEIGYVSPYIRLEVFYRLIEQNGICKITNEKMVDFTGYMDSNRPKHLNARQGLTDNLFLLVGDNHWSPDRIDATKGYYFENLQIVRRVVNECKGKIEGKSLNKLNDEYELINIISSMNLKNLSVFKDTLIFVLKLKSNNNDVIPTKLDQIKEKLNLLIG
ncbi:hypothetical protein [Lysinibacillus capsici]|uniref:hypothetical protein n=1 Tax=Lysinibacillus capsici TaxID=2115968 RepID=UPI0034E38993